MKTLFRCAVFPALLGGLLILVPFVLDAQTNRGVSVPPERLPKELRDLSPRDYFVQSAQEKVGVIHALEGKVIVIHETTGEAYFAMAGDPVHEKDTLITLSDSKCRIRFVDEDLVTMAPETRFSVEDFEDQREEGRKRSLFKMIKGKAMFYAMRLFRYKDTRFTVATPTNTIGVRGTKFGAHVYYLNEGTADRGVRVADIRGGIAPYLAQAATGRSFTDCFSEDGVLDVDGQTVAPGQMFSGRTGQVIPTPPEVIRSFQQETEIRTDGATSPGPDQGGAEKEAASPPPPAAVTGGVAPLVADIQANITNVVQLQTVQEVEKENEQPEHKPRKDIGYFAAMLTSTHGSGYLKDVFIQFDDHVQYENGVAKGMGLADSGSYIEGKAVGVSDTAPGLSRINLGVSGDSGDLGSTRLIQDTSIGSNDYMKWGYWTMTELVTIGTEDYYINNKAYYLIGQATDNLDRVRNLGNVTYSGSAWGTFWSAAGGADMSGSFNTKVNFNSGALTDFNLSVSGGGRSASISGAGGNIYEYGNLANNSCSHFDIDHASGEWKLDGVAPVYKAAQGTLYGPNGEHIGGVWGMYGNSSEGAAGIFQGSR
jgi:hypothetical protein